MDIIVPQVGESIVEAEIGEWFKQDGELVSKDDLLLELETEKINVELNADVSGKLTILAQQGETERSAPSLAGSMKLRLPPNHCPASRRKRQLKPSLKCHQATRRSPNWLPNEI